MAGLSYGRMLKVFRTPHIYTLDPRRLRLNLELTEQRTRAAFREAEEQGYRFKPHTLSVQTWYLQSN